MLPENECLGINYVIGEAKRFLAYEIVKRLKQANKVNVLKSLARGVSINEKKKGNKHQVFRLSFDAKEIDYETIGQTMDYIHYNPIQGKWSLVDDYKAYEHSSAAYYEANADKPTFLTDFRSISTSSEPSSSDSEGH